MAGFYQELIDLLLRAGCHMVRQGRGDHEIWYRPISQKHFTVDHGTKSRHTANQTLKDAGLEKQF